MLRKSRGKEAVEMLWKALRSHWLWGCTICAIAISRLFWYAIQQPYLIYPDSTQYIAFDTVAVLQGNMTKACSRPPLYGIFLDLMEVFFGENYLNAVTFVQMTLSILSIVVFAKLLRRVGISSPWCELCVFLYGVTPAVVGWENTILTESFSLSGTVLFLYWVVLYIQQHRLRYGVGAICLAAALTFLRPQFMTYMALLVVFLVLKLIFPFHPTERRNLLILLLLQVALWGSVLGYSKVHQQSTGIFSLTTTLPIQNLRICIDRGYYTDLDDEEVAAFIAQQMEETGSPREACDATLAEFGLVRAGETSERYLSSHVKENFLDTVDVIINDLQTRFLGYGLYSNNINTAASGICFKMYALQMAVFGCITVAHALCASLLEGAAMIAVWVRRRTLPWLHMALFSISVCTTFSTYFVTCAEYMRTMVSVVPYLYCMLALFLQMCSNGIRGPQPQKAESL